MYRSALATRQKLAADFPLVSEYRQEVGRAYHNLGEFYIGGDTHAIRPAEAEATLRAAVAIREKLVDESPAVTEYRQELADSFASLGDCLAGHDKLAETEAAYRRALAIREKLAADAPAVPVYRVDVARLCISLGRLFADGLDPAAGLPWFDRAVDGLEAEQRQHPGDKARQALSRAHAGRARTLTRLQRPADADWDRAAALADPAGRPGVVLERATELAKAGDTDRAAEVLATLAADPSVSPTILYDAACICATGNHCDRAVMLLRQAIVCGYRDGPQFLGDQDLAPLRGRADFADLLWDVADMPAK